MYLCVSVLYNKPQRGLLLHSVVHTVPDLRVSPLRDRCSVYWLGVLREMPTRQVIDTSQPTTLYTRVRTTPELISLWLELNKSVRNWTHFPDGWWLSVEPLNLPKELKPLTPPAETDGISTNIINPEKKCITLVLLRHAKVSQCREMTSLPKMCWETLF